MVDHRILRRSLTAGLFLSIAGARPMVAQQLDDRAFSGSVVVTQPLTSGVPGDVAGQVVIDPSANALAPWGALGMRWLGLLERSAEPIATLGIRLQRRSFRAALGLSRDVAYSSLASDRPSSGDSVRTPFVDTMGARPSILSTGFLTSTGGSVPGYTTLPVTDVVGSADWLAGSVTLGLQSGWRISGPGRGRPWLSATIAAPLIHRFGIVAGLEHWRARAFAYNAPRVTFGLSWRPGPSSRRRPKPAVVSTNPPAADSAALRSPTSAVPFIVLRQTNGIQVRFRVRDARHVEIRSNLTAWVPTPLERADDVTWRVTLPAEPGVHRLAIRVDGGAWLPPPGLPVGSDGYGASVGVLMLEP